MLLFGRLLLLFPAACRREVILAHLDPMLTS